ncbi:MAG: hypothetical protein U0M53_05385 [Oscillospiraceae bacterium]|nr:hypothetical protein [Oscillospiraceae bacterium]
MNDIFLNINITFDRVVGAALNGYCIVRSIVNGAAFNCKAIYALNIYTLKIVFDTAINNRYIFKVFIVALHFNGGKAAITHLVHISGKGAALELDILCRRWIQIVCNIHTPGNSQPIEGYALKAGGLIIAVVSAISGSPADIIIRGIPFSAVFVSRRGRESRQYNASIRSKRYVCNRAFVVVDSGIFYIRVRDNISWFPAALIILRSAAAELGGAAEDEHFIVRAAAEIDSLAVNGAVCAVERVLGVFRRNRPHVP